MTYIYINSTCRLIFWVKAMPVVYQLTLFPIKWSKPRHYSNFVRQVGQNLVSSIKVRFVFTFRVWPHGDRRLYRLGIKVGYGGMDERYAMNKTIASRLNDPCSVIAALYRNTGSSYSRYKILLTAVSKTSITTFLEL